MKQHQETFQFPLGKRLHIGKTRLVYFSVSRDDACLVSKFLKATIETYAKQCEDGRIGGKGLLAKINSPLYSSRYCAHDEFFHGPFTLSTILD